MVEVRQTETFAVWLDALADREARKRIAARILRLQSGLFGDVKPIRGAVSELRVDHGPGYRIYFTRQSRTIVILLCGGDKRSQGRDIERALEMAAELE